MSDQDRNGGVMPISRFAAIVEAYGADPRRWPDEERRAAEALLAASPEARALRDVAAPLDDMLSAAAAPAPSAALRAAILQSAPRAVPAGASAAAPGIGSLLQGLWQALAGALTGELGGLRPAGAVLGVALVLGAMTGGAVGTQTAATATDTTAQDMDFVQLALFDDSYGEF